MSVLRSEPPAPMEPVPWPEAFDDPGWLWQLKWDGVRALVAADAWGARVWGRRGQLRTDRYPEVAAAVAAAAGGAPLLLDGEIVALGEDGRPSFHRVLRRALQTRPPAGLLARVPVVYAAFDVLVRGADLRRLPVEQRLERLAALRRSEHLLPVTSQRGGGVAFVRSAAAAGLEGAVAKRLGSAYLPGPSADWRKVKPRRTLRALVVGCKLSAGGRLRSLALAVPVDGTLVYVGDAGSGLTEAMRARLQAALASAPGWTPPFPAPRAAGGDARIWRAPRFAARVTYAELTPEGLLRAPALAAVEPLPEEGRLW